MFTRGNIHLWMIGSMSFIGFAYAEISQSQEDSNVPVDGQVAQTNDHLISMVEAEALYTRRCGACHSVDANRIGPRHRSVVGRQAGSLTDYDYSDALQNAAFVWDATKLDQWLENPEQLVPGQKMGFRLSDEAERTAIIRYLEAQSD